MPVCKSQQALITWVSVQIDLIIRKESDPNPYTITCDLAERLVFGRSVVSPVNLAGPEISREHFALFSRNGGICVQNLSSNGTIVNGKAVPQKKPQKLSAGDVIYVPGYQIELSRRPPIAAVYEPQRFAVSAPPEEEASRWSESFTFWEVVVIAAAIASFALIIYYVTR